MLVKNASAVEIGLDSLGMPEIRLQPGEMIELPDHLCAAGRRPNGARKPSLMERCIPQLVPADEAAEKAWRATPAAPEPAPKPVTAARMGNVPPGVRAAMAAKAEAAQKLAKPADPTPAPPVQPEAKPAAPKPAPKAPAKPGPIAKALSPKE